MSETTLTIDDDTTFNLINYTETITTSTKCSLQFGVSAVPAGKYWWPYNFTVTLTGTLNQYYTSFANAMNYYGHTPKLQIYSNQYYLHDDGKYIYGIHSYNDFTPIEKDEYLSLYGYINKGSATSNISVKEILPQKYFIYGIPLKLMDQFKKTYTINIPKGIYTYSEFKELLTTVEWPTGYVFDPSTATLSTSCAPEYTFAIDTNVFDIPQKFVRSLCFTDLLPKQSKVFVINNQYVYTALQSNCSVIMKNSVPTCIDNVDSVIPFCMNSNNNYIECQQEFEQSAPVLQLANNVLNRIIDNSNYTYIQLTGTLLSTNIIGSNNDVTINDTTFHVTVPQRINRKFKLPLTISGGSDIMFMCRVKYLN